MNEMIMRDGKMMPVQTANALELKHMAEMMATMAAMLQATTESMEQLRRQVRLLEKVTPAQAAAINRAIRERAVEICAIYTVRDDRGEKLAAAEIRKAVKLQFGAGAVKEVPRCDYEIALEQVRTWDDYRAMKAIREKVKGWKGEA
jgi:hypothetical protein